MRGFIIYLTLLNYLLSFKCSLDYCLIKYSSNGNHTIFVHRMSIPSPYEYLATLSACFTLAIGKVS